MTRFYRTYTALFALGTLALSPVMAQVSAVPQTMNFQGRLATPGGNPVPNGTYSIRFSLWNVASGGTAANEKWNQTIANVQVKNGTFAVLLNTNTAGLFNSNLWLEIKIGTDAALTPRQPLVTVPYAFKSDLALTVPDGSITNAKIVSVDWSKILNPPASNFALPYAGVYNDPTRIAFTLRAQSNAIAAYSTIRTAPTIYAENSSPGSIGYLAGNNFGVYGFSPAGAGVYGTSSGSNGVEGHSTLAYNAGVYGSADTNLAYGVTGKHSGTNNIGYLGTANTGVYGDAVDASSNGVWGHANNVASGVYGVNDFIGNGVYGTSTGGIGVYGASTYGIGVRGTSTNNHGIVGITSQQGSFGVLARQLAGGYTALFSDGRAGGTSSWENFSDARFKTHVVTLENALENVLKLRGVNFDWDWANWPDRHFSQGRQIGFIAQELEKVIPELVFTDHEGYKSVTYATLTPILVEAIKTQQKQRNADKAEIVALKKDNDAIKAKNAELEARLERIEAALKAQK